jgi:hypothetical protein
MIQPSVGPPLGLRIPSGWKESDATLGDNSVLLFYTDGLIENHLPGQSAHRDGEQRLLQSLHREAFDIDSLLSELGPDGFQDDVAVMAVALSSSR